MADNTVAVGLLLRLEAAPGRENNIQRLLGGAISMVNEEPKAMTWFGVRFGPSTFGIFDVLPDVVGREAHLSGGVAQASQHDAALSADPPGIQRIDVIASKLPE